MNVETQPSDTADVEMAGDEGTTVVAPPAEDAILPFAEGGDETKVERRESYITYLVSPMVRLVVEDMSLNAHQALLAKSPFFAPHVAEWEAGGSDLGTHRTVELKEGADTVGAFLEYLYTGDYFPRRLPGSRTLESDPSIPEVDATGDQLLRHARVYTLAEKFGMPDLKRLASTKIHCVNSTARGEIAYARYVYANTPAEDTAIRDPVANFWATRSHTLRREAEEEFRTLCLEHPQFGYDVLSKSPARAIRLPPSLERAHAPVPSWHHRRSSPWHTRDIPFLEAWFLLTVSAFAPHQLVSSMRSSDAKRTTSCNRPCRGRRANGRARAAAARLDA